MTKYLIKNNCLFLCFSRPHWPWTLCHHTHGDLRHPHHPHAAPVSDGLRQGDQPSNLFTLIGNYLIDQTQSQNNVTVLVCGYFYNWCWSSREVLPVWLSIIAETAIMVIDLGPKTGNCWQILCKVAEETFDEKLKASAQRAEFL